MARYTGPKWKISRRENYDVFGSSKWRKRSSLPGVHPTSKGRPSNYSIQFREKQKLKRMYGLLEKQFKNTYVKASKSTGNTGLTFLQLLELRLDNVVYKLGLARSIMQARQFVSHGHVTVNGKRVNIPSYNLKINDVIQYDEKFAKSEFASLIKNESKAMKSIIPAYLANNKISMVPTREMIDQGIREQLVVELYSR
jgi:small subunit ribosomal protein S4